MLKHGAHIAEVFDILFVLPQDGVDLFRVHAHELIENQIRAFNQVHGGDGLDLEIGRHEEENNAAKRQSVNDRSEEVPRLVRREVLSEQGSHDWRLPKEQSVDEDDLEDALQVGHKHGQGC